MKKQFGILIFISLFFIFLGIKCEAQDQYSAMISKMEKSLFGVEYNGQSNDARIKRIEETVYGSTSSNSIDQKMSRLTKDLSADLIGQEIKPKRDTFEEEQESIKEDIPKADSNINYPIVDMLEKNVFNKEFKSTDINQRLANLEQKVFRKTFNDDLNSRTDRLKHAVMPEITAQKNDDDDYNNSNSYSSLMDETSQFQDDGFGTDSYQSPLRTSQRGASTGFGAGIPQSLQTSPYYNENNSVLDEYQDNSDITIPLASLERSILRKSFPDDTVSNRLLRLEVKVFNSTFVDDDSQTRLDRIASAYQAKKTSKKYDGNKFAQHSAAAMQIGAILLMILAAVL